jgi:hypothetical protein
MINVFCATLFVSLFRLWCLIPNAISSFVSVWQSEGRSIWKWLGGGTCPLPALHLIHDFRFQRVQAYSRQDYSCASGHRDDGTSSPDTPRTLLWKQEQIFLICVYFSSNCRNIYIYIYIFIAFVCVSLCVKVWNTFLYNEVLFQWA